MYMAACRIGALFAFAIFLLCLLLPGAYLSNYGIEPTASAQVMVQRASPAFLVVAVALWGIGTEPPSPLRKKIIYGLALFFVAVAVTGIYHISTGQAGPGLWAGVIAELVAAGLLVVLRNRA
ncbi:MAG: hypothetical protein ACU0DW_03955 [Shimia sp.]